MDGIPRHQWPINLFNVNDDTKNHIVAKLLYLCRRTRQDLQTAIAFLCTRIKSGHRQLKETNQGPKNV